MVWGDGFIACSKWRMKATQVGKKLRQITELIEIHNLKMIDSTQEQKS
jgi:hypothetical protein